MLALFNTTDWSNFITGYPKEITKTVPGKPTETTIEKPQGKALWDWLQLLIVPIVLAIGGFSLSQIQKGREERMTQQRFDLQEQRLERQRINNLENRYETALQKYFDKMTELLLHEKLHVSKQKEEVRRIARIWTLNVLLRIGYNLKGNVLQFLYDSNLIDKGKPMIDLKTANFEGANLQGARLCEANLKGFNLGGANFEGADLRGANLTDAKIGQGWYVYARFGKLEIHNANLSRANLRGADLRGADLRGAYTDLRTQLQGARYNKEAMQDKDEQGNPIIIQPTQWPSGFTFEKLKDAGAICVDCETP